MPAVSISGSADHWYEFKQTGEWSRVKEKGQIRKFRICFGVLPDAAHGAQRQKAKAFSPSPQGDLRPLALLIERDGATPNLIKF